MLKLVVIDRTTMTDFAESELNAVPFSSLASRQPLSLTTQTPDWPTRMG